MDFSRDLAQSIVNKIMSVVPFSVNIIDGNAVVVGSGDTSRIGTHHSPASQILHTGEAVEVSCRDLDPPEGSRPGIGLPILFQGEPIGVIGVSGDPEEVRGYARIAKALVELMLEHEALREKGHLESMARRAFISNLISGTIRDDEPWEERARLLGIDLTLPRVILLAELDGYGKAAGGRIGASSNPKDAEFDNQRTKLKFYEMTRSVFDHPEDLSVEIDNDRIVVFTCMASLRGAQTRHRRLEFLLQKLGRQVRSQFDMSTTIGVSTECCEMREYKRAYAEALQALTIGKRLYGGGQCYHVETLRLGKAIASISAETRRALVDSCFRDLGSSYGTELVATLSAFFDHGLKTADTARTLHIHRNTLRHRFKKIRDLSGCDVHSLDDLLLLRLAYLCRLYERPTTHN